MGRLKLSRPTPATAISIVALVVATGGTSYAAAKIDTPQIKREAVTTPKIANGTIKNVDLSDGVLEDAPSGRWLLVDADGEIVAQSGGFEIIAAYPELPNTSPEGQPSNALRANGNVYIDAGDNLSDNGFVASIALQNRIDQNGDGVTTGRSPLPDTNPEFSGEISVSQCGVTDQTPTNCAPTGAQNASAFVVSPRNSDGTVTTDDNRKRFYVTLTGD